MYKLAFAILLVCAAQPATFGESSGRAGRSSARVERRADKPGRERAGGTTKPSGRGSENATGANSVRTASRRSRPESKPASAARLAPAASGGRARRAAGSRAAASVTYPSGEYLTVVKGGDAFGEEHYDPTGSGNPLLDASGANSLKMLSDNFSVGEIARSGGKKFDFARIDPRQVICLQAIRDRVGKPVFIRSGYRSFWHNVEIYRRKGKKPTKSQHISGRASDIWVHGMTGLEVAKAAIDACGPDIALGLAPDYAHVDVRGHPNVWGYDGVPRQQTAELERYRMGRRLASRGGAQRRRRVSHTKRT